MSGSAAGRIDAREEPHAARAEALGRPQEERIDLAHAGDGGEEDREERRVGDEPDLRGLADPDPDDEHRQHRQRRDRPEQLDERLDDVANRREMPGRQAERDAEGGAGAEAERHALERRRHVDPELAPDRHVEHAAEHEPGAGQEDRVEELRTPRRRPRAGSRAPGNASTAPRRNASARPRGSREPRSPASISSGTLLKNEATCDPPSRSSASLAERRRLPAGGADPAACPPECLRLACHRSPVGRAYEKRGEADASECEAGEG